MYFLFSGGIVADAIRSDGHEVVVDNFSMRHWVESAKRLNEYCKANNIDVIINHASAPVAVLIMRYVIRRNKNIKWLMYFHSSPGDLNLKNRIKYIPFMRYQAKHSDARIAISNYVKNSAAKVYGVSPNEIQVVYNGVDTSKYKKRVIQKSDVVEFIYVGRLYSGKGVQVLVEALAHIEDLSSLHVTIVGAGPQRQELEDQVKTLGLSDKVSFLGSRMDVPKLLLKADYFVHPAICNEGFGITLIEAMSTGLPCIAFKRGAIPEIIDNGRNGYVIEKIDAGMLAETLVKCVEDRGTDKYEAMADNAAKTAQKFNISEMVSDLEAIIERCKK
jgi:glycosyltransferase involved in cell wall biosynthesis